LAKILHFWTDQEMRNTN